MAENTTSSVFEVGKEFGSYEEFLEVFNTFCTKNYQPMTIATNNKRQVTILCRHGRKRESASAGKRTHLHYNYLACPAKISCYKPTNSNVVRITSVDLNHNHEISRTAYGTFGADLDSREKEVLADLRETNRKVSHCSSSRQPSAWCLAAENQIRKFEV